MSEPEIARRCSHCGVTLRQNAAFCPQCGEQIGDVKVVETSTADTQIGDGRITAAPVPESPTSTMPPVSHASSPTSVAGNVRERVEKIRHVSSIVIDQAAYDPSLRFILVAAGLFLFFLLLLILSKVIG